MVETYGEKTYSNEWADGIWYGKNGFREKTHSYKAGWKSDSKGYWYQDASGWYAKNKAYTIGGKSYQFDNAGYCTNP